MNTSKQVNVIIGLMFVFLIGTLLYFVWDDTRAGDAEERQIVENAERGGRLFSLNCRSCHGISGLGLQENLKLPGFPLNVQELNRPTDPLTGLPDLGELMNRQSIIRDTIRCGRVGTLMPQWSEDQGGPLNDFQIEQLVALITGAMPGLEPPDDTNAVSELGWEAAAEEADHADIQEFKGKLLAAGVGPEDTLIVLTDAEGLTADSLLRIDEEVVRIVEPFEEDDEILVKRGAFGTEAAAHEEGSQLFAGPIEPPTGPLTGEGQEFAPCGQRGVAPAAAASPTPTPTPSAGETPTPVGTTAEIKMTPIIQFDKTELTVAADTDVTITADNTEGAVPHNFAVYASQDAADSGEAALAATEICIGPCTDTTTVNLSAGEYFFRCDVHPIQMVGTFIVASE